MQHERFDLRVVAETFVAGCVRRPHVFYFHRPVPVRGSRDGSMVGAEANQECRVGEPRAGQLSNVMLATRTHLGGRRVANV